MIHLLAALGKGEKLQGRGTRNTRMARTGVTPALLSGVFLSFMVHRSDRMSIKKAEDCNRQ